MRFSKDSALDDCNPNFLHKGTPTPLFTQIWAQQSSHNILKQEKGNSPTFHSSSQAKWSSLQGGLIVEILYCTDCRFVAQGHGRSHCTGRNGWHLTWVQRQKWWVAKTDLWGESTTPSSDAPEMFWPSNSYPRSNEFLIVFAHSLPAHTKGWRLFLPTSPASEGPMSLDEEQSESSCSLCFLNSPVLSKKMKWRACELMSALSLAFLPCSEAPA